MIGEIIAIISVLVFVISNAIFKRIDTEVSPSQINAVRTIIGFITFLIIALAVGQFTTIFTFPPMLWFWLILSFVIGQIIGDTAYFKAQEMLGTTIALSIAMTFPIFTTIFSVIIQNTTIPFYYFISMPLVIIGVIVLAVGKDKQNVDLIEELRQNDGSEESENEQNNSEDDIDKDQIMESEIISQTKKSRKYLLLATLVALLAAVTWGAAAVLTEVALNDVSEFLGSPTYSSILGNVVRFPAAAIVLSFMTIPDKKKKIKEWNKLTWLLLIIGSLIGTSLGLYLYNEALVRSNAVFVSIIGASSPIFAIPIAWLINKEKINWIGLIGVILTIAGVVLIFVLQLIYGNIQ